MWNSLWLWCYFCSLKGPQNTITIMNSTSGCSSRCPSRCAIHCGVRAWAFPHNRVRHFRDNPMATLLHQQPLFAWAGQKALSRLGFPKLGHIFPKILKNVVKLLTLQFSHVFLLQLVFFKNLILPAERRIFLKNKKHNYKNQKKGGQVIDLWWPSYWPYSIYIYL